LVLLEQGCSRTDEQFETVLKSPDQFQGQEIEISGIFHHRFEDVAIYLTNEGETEKALWINYSEMLELPKSLDGLDGERIRIKGKFNKTDKGHLGQYAGSLDDAKIE